MRHWPATLAVVLLFALAAWSTWTNRERLVTVTVTGQLAPFENLEGEHVAVSVAFHELHLEFSPDGRRSFLDETGRLRVEPLQVDNRNRYGAQVRPDGSFQVKLTFPSREVPTRCTLAFARVNQVTRRLRQISLTGPPENLVGAASDLRPYHRRRMGTE